MYLCFLVNKKYEAEVDSRLERGINLGITNDYQISKMSNRYVKSVKLNIYTLPKLWSERYLEDKLFQDIISLVIRNSTWYHVVIS